MAAPLYNNIKGTTAGTPGTGAFTPNAASTGYSAWSTVPTGWWGLVRYEDGSSWELEYSYWNGTTLSRASTQFVSSSSGSQLTLTSAATAELVADGDNLMAHIGSTPMRTLAANGSATLPVGAGGIATPTAIGTAAAATPANTNFLTMQIRNTLTSATTANASGGLTIAGGGLLFFGSSTAGLGGWEYRLRAGWSAIPTGPRLALGMSQTPGNFNAGASDPSAFTGTQMAMFAKDSADTNIQLMTGNGTTVTKTDTGIPLTANGVYDFRVWTDPGSISVGAWLVRVDPGAPAIWYKAPFSTTVPLTGQSLQATLTSSLSATTGTAIVMNFMSLALKAGF